MLLLAMRSAADKGFGENTEQTEITEQTERQSMEEKLIYSAESYAIKGACMEVYRTLGNGFLESVYQECLEIEFNRCGILFLPQKPLTLIYQGQVLKQTYKPDFVCYDKIIVEIKAVSKLNAEHQAQVMNYLKATGFQLGLLFNFGHYPLLEQIRIPNIKDFR
jgi:GxxExxY protein